MADATAKQFMQDLEKGFLPEKAAGIDAVIQFRLSGAEAGDYLLTIKDAKCSITEGIAPNPKMTLSADGTDFRNILAGKLDPMMAFMQGKIKVAGDINLGMRLMSLFKMK